MKEDVELTMAGANFRRGVRIAAVCAFTACALSACNQDYRSSAPEPVFNRVLTEALRQNAAEFPRSALSRQVLRVDCYVAGLLSSDMLL